MKWFIKKYEHDLGYLYIERLIEIHRFHLRFHVMTERGTWAWHVGPTRVSTQG